MPPSPPSAPLSPAIGSGSGRWKERDTSGVEGSDPLGERAVAVAAALTRGDALSVAVGVGGGDASEEGGIELIGVAGACGGGGCCFTRAASSASSRSLSRRCRRSAATAPATAPAAATAKATARSKPLEGEGIGRLVEPPRSGREMHEKKQKKIFRKKKITRRQCLVG